MFSRILVGMNGSAHAARALAVAVDLAVAERGRLTLISTVPHRPRGRGAARSASTSCVGIRSATTRPCSAQSGETVPAQVPTTLLVRQDPAADRLLDEVRRNHCDLIVVGSGNRGRLRSALLGGLGPRLQSNSPVPGLVIPAPTMGARGGERRRLREHSRLRAKRLHRHGSAAA